MKKTSINKELLTFCLIAIGFSWIFWIPKILIGYGIEFPKALADFFQSPYNPAAMGPFVAAIIMSYRERKLKELMQKAVKFDFSTKWYAIIFLLFPFLTFSSLLILKFTSGYTFNLDIFTKPWLIVYFFFEIMLLGGPLQEEFGWRGYALDKLQKRFSAVKSSAILGVIWLIWHFPLYLIPESGAQYQQLISAEIVSMALGSLITMILVSILFTWIYNNTKKSLLSVLIFHTMLNLSAHKLFPTFANPQSLPYFSLLLTITTIIVVSVFGAKDLMKKK
jgi:hypothetical protein